MASNQCCACENGHQCQEKAFEPNYKSPFPASRFPFPVCEKHAELYNDYFWGRERIPSLDLYYLYETFLYDISNIDIKYQQLTRYCTQDMYNDYDSD